MKKQWVLSVAVLLLSLIIVFPAYAKVVCVKTDGLDTNDGSSWELAKQTVQVGLNAAVSGDEVWVKTGTYVGCITLKNGVKLYGGFVGDEINLSERQAFPRPSPDLNETVLSAIISGSVVTSPSGAAANTRIDGFTIRNGNVNCGGGIYCKSSSPTIINNTITNNFASSFGGGIYCYTSSPIITNNTITSNIASSCGGGIFCFDSSPMICNNILQRNEAHCDSGGGIYQVGGSSVILNNTVVGNYSKYKGGGVYCNGSSATISNNVIKGNNTTFLYGAGIYCYNSSDNITNNTITNNSSISGGGGIHCNEASPILTNNLIAFNSSGVHNSGTSGVPTLRNNCIYNPDGYNYSGLSPGADDISSDPKLVAQEYGYVHIQPDSPCIDAGYDGAILPSWTDMDGQPRKQGLHVDIGADESDGTTWDVTPLIVRVSLLGNDANDGSTWALAKRTIQNAIDVVSKQSGEVWVAAGTYNERIYLKTYTYVYGGFSGSESVRDERDWRTNITTLDMYNSRIVDASNIGRVACIDGFTICNGYCGIDCLSASPFISNNVITSNQTGISCAHSHSPIISNNIIKGNNNGIYCISSIELNCISPIVIINNTIVGNNGSGIYCNSSMATISNNIIAFNGSGINEPYEDMQILHNNCVYNPNGYNYSGLEPGLGDISADPLFVDSLGGDYHLQVTSPCINAGWNDALSQLKVDFYGEPRIQGEFIDIGVDECWLSAGSVQDAKKAAEGVLVDIDGLVVTGGFPGFFYIESGDRSNGIRVDKADHGLTSGMKAHVIGSVDTDLDGERYIAATDASSAGEGTLDPVGMNNDTLGGGQYGLQAGVINGFGLNNIGLFIKTWGKVMYAEETFFYLDDGSNLDDGSGHIGVKVYGTVPVKKNKDPVGRFVSVTGISSCERPDVDIIRIIRTRGTGDVLLLD